MELNNIVTLSSLKENYNIYISQNNYKKRPSDQYDVFIVESLIGSLNNDYGLDRVYVSKSNIHGLGVFAKTKINKGDIITFYPAHYVIYCPNGHGLGKITSLCIINSDLIDELGLEIDHKKRNHYLFDISDLYQICGDHRIYDNINFVGHMINDGAVGHSTLENYDKKDNEIYDKISSIRSNCIFGNIKNLIIPIIATKDINIGDEILVTYKYGYWTSINTK